MDLKKRMSVKMQNLVKEKRSSSPKTETRENLSKMNAKLKTKVAVKPKSLFSSYGEPEKCERETIKIDAFQKVIDEIQSDPLIKEDPQEYIENMYKKNGELICPKESTQEVDIQEQFEAIAKNVKEDIMNKPNWNPEYQSGINYGWDTPQGSIITHEGELYYAINVIRWRSFSPNNIHAWYLVILNVTKKPYKVVKVCFIMNHMRSVWTGNNYYKTNGFIYFMKKCFELEDSQDPKPLITKSTSTLYRLNLSTMEEEPIKDVTFQDPHFTCWTLFVLGTIDEQQFITVAHVKDEETGEMKFVLNQSNHAYGAQGLVKIKDYSDYIIIDREQRTIVDSSIGKRTWKSLYDELKALIRFAMDEDLIDDIDPQVNLQNFLKRTVIQVNRVEICREYYKLPENEEGIVKKCQLFSLSNVNEPIKETNCQTGMVKAFMQSSIKIDKETKMHWVHKIQVFDGNSERFSHIYDASTQKITETEELTGHGEQQVKLWDPNNRAFRHFRIYRAELDGKTEVFTFDRIYAPKMLILFRDYDAKTIDSKSDRLVKKLGMTMEERGQWEFDLLAHVPEDNSRVIGLQLNPHYKSGRLVDEGEGQNLFVIHRESQILQGTMKGLTTYKTHSKKAGRISPLVEKEGADERLKFLNKIKFAERELIHMHERLPNVALIPGEAKVMEYDPEKDELTTTDLMSPNDKRGSTVIEVNGKLKLLFHDTSAYFMYAKRQGKKYVISFKHRPMQREYIKFVVIDYETLCQNDEMTIDLSTKTKAQIEKMKEEEKEKEKHKQQEQEYSARGDHSSRNQILEEREEDTKTEIYFIQKKDGKYIKIKQEDFDSQHDYANYADRPTHFVVPDSMSSVFPVTVNSWGDIYLFHWEYPDGEELPEFSWEVDTRHIYNFIQSQASYEEKGMIVSHFMLYGNNWHWFDKVLLEVKISLPVQGPQIPIFEQVGSYHIQWGHEIKDERYLQNVGKKRVIPYCQGQSKGVMIYYNNRDLFFTTNVKPKYENAYCKFGYERFYLGSNQQKSKDDTVTLLYCWKNESSKLTEIEQKIAIDKIDKTLEHMIPFDMEKYIFFDYSTYEDTVMNLRPEEVFFGAPSLSYRMLATGTALYPLESEAKDRANAEKDKEDKDEPFTKGLCMWFFNHHRLPGFDFRLRSPLEYASAFKVNDKVAGCIVDEIRKGHFKDDLIDMVMFSVQDIIINMPKQIKDLFCHHMAVVEGAKFNVARMIVDKVAQRSQGSDSFKLGKDCSINHIQQMKATINHRQKIRDDTAAQGAQVFEVDHFYLDFTMTQMKFHMDQLETGESGHNLDDLTISEFICELKELESSFMLPTLMDIIDIHNAEAKLFHKRIFMIYFFLNVVPLLAYMVLTDDVPEVYYVKMVLLSIALLVQLMIIVFEAFQFKHAGGLGNYIAEDPWNLQDIFHSTMFTIFYIQQLSNGLTIHNDERSVLNAIVCLLVIIMAFIKVLFFLRIYEEMGSLVQMLIITMSSMGSFIAFLFISILLFAFSFNALGISYAGADYKDVNDFFAILIQTFRNSIGDIAIPDYSVWAHKDPTEYKIIMFTIWTVWFINLMINLIILLNFLIAVISQVYDQVIALQLYTLYQFKADFNREYFIIKSQIVTLDQFRFLVWTQLKEKDYAQAEDVNLGIVNNIKRNNVKQLDELRQKVVKAVGNKIDAIELKMKTMESDRATEVENMQAESKEMSKKISNIDQSVKSIQADIKTIMNKLVIREVAEE